MDIKNNNNKSLLPSINNLTQSIESQLSQVSISLIIDANLRCFSGHFENSPVVAGVVQLDWAVKFARRYLDMQGDVVSVSVLKFQKLLLPGMSVQLTLTKKSESQFSFNYHTHDNSFSSARVVFSL